MNSEAVFDNVMDDEVPRSILPGQIIRVITRKWLLLLICGFVGAILGLLAASQMTRTYTASGDIVIDAKSFAIPELQGAISGQGSPDMLPAVRTAAIDLKSPALLESVVRQLDLTKYKYFNASLQKPTLIEEAVGEAKSMLPFLFPPLPSQPGQETEEAAMALAKRLTIFYDNQSLSVEASVILPDPKLAAQIVNAILNRYIADQGENRVRFNKAANADIRMHLGEVKKQVDDLDAQARDLRAKNELVTIMPAGSLGQQRLSELGTAQANAVANLQQLQAKLALATRLTKEGNPAELADVLDSPTISRLREQQAIAAEHLARLSATVVRGSRLLGAAEGEYRQMQTAINQEAARIVKSLGSQVAAAKDRVSSATQALDVASTAAAKASLIQANIAQVEKEATSRLKVYQDLLERAAQTSVSPEVARQSPGVYIGSPAVPPLFPSGPHTKIVAALGMLAGMMIGSVFAVKRGNEISISATPEEIATHTHLPLLGVIPMARGNLVARDQMSSAEQDQALGLLYARMRHQSARSGKELRTVLFVPADGEDTSSLGHKFADIAGREGERVLLIDTRSDAASPPPAGKPSGHTKSARREGGLEAVLDGQRAWHDVLVRNPDSSSNLLPVSNRSLDELDRKAATRLRSLLREAADDYTLIVVASAWDARSVEASHLVQAADLTVLIVNPRRARQSAVMAAVEHLTSIKSNIGLAVITR